MARIFGWGARRNSEPQTAHEGHVESHHEIVSGIRLNGRAVASRSMGRHRRTIAGVAEHPAVGSPMASGLVDYDHANGNSPPDLFLIRYRRVVGVLRRIIRGAQAKLERLQAGTKQTNEVLDAALRLNSRRLVGEGESLDAV